MDFSFPHLIYVYDNRELIVGMVGGWGGVEN